jgi:predicted ATPase
VVAVAEQIFGRGSELDVLAHFLAGVPEGPTGLLIEGEAGIGKTTLWKDALDDAAERSYRVLAARPTEAEMALPFAALGDLLAEVSTETLARLPEPQRRAVEIALLRAAAEGAPTHRRAVSLGLLGVLQSLARSSPLVVAVDDAQWLDRPSRMPSRSPYAGSRRSLSASSCATGASVEARFP